MNLFEAFGTISLKDEGFSKGLSNAGNKFSSFTSSAVKGTVGFTNGIIKGMAVGGVAAVGFGVAAAKVGADFEQSMAQVAATMGITADKSDADYAKMSKAAKDAGASTKFSAGEAAEGLNYLALAGFNTTDAVTTMPKILNLAAAGNLDLAYASDMVTDSMTALGLGVDDVDSFIDQMARTSQKSNTSVGQLGEGMLTVGGIAKGLAGGTVELSTSLGVLANAGIKGSEGGTKLRNVLIDLSDPTSKATKGLGQLGISAYDLEGNLRPLPEIFGDFNSAMDGMTTEEKREIIGKMFNKQDMAAVEAFLGTSPEMWNELGSAIENSEGTAKQMADTLQNTLKGSIEQLKSATSVFAIDFYEGINNPLKNVAQSLTSFVTNSRSSMNLLQYAVENGAISSGEAINMFANIFGEGLSSMVTTALDYIPQIIEAAASFIQGFILGITSNIGSIASSASEIIQTFYEALYEIFPLLSEIGVEIIATLIEGFISHYEFIFTAGIDLIAKLLEGIVTKLPDLIPRAQEAVMNIAQSLADNLPIILNAGIQIVMAIMQGLAETLPDLIPILVEAIVGLVDVIIQNLPLFIDAAITLVTVIRQALLTAAPQLVEAAIKLVIAVASAIISAFPKMLVADVMYFKGIFVALMQIIPLILNGIDSLIGAILSAIGGWFARLFSATAQAFMSMVSAIVSVIGPVLSALSSMFSSISSTISGWASKIFSLAKTIFSKIAEAVGSTLGALSSALAGVWNTINSVLGGVPAKMLGLGKNIIKGLIDGIGSMAGAVMDKVSSIASGVVDKVKSVFSIFSPSRVMKKLGGYVTEGFVDGIEDDKEGLIKTADDTYSSVFDVLDDLAKNSYNVDVGMNGKTGLSDIQNNNNSLIGSGTGSSVNVTQNIYAKAQSPAELLSEARRQQEMAVLMNV